MLLRVKFMKNIVLENLSFGYNSLNVLKSINAQFEPNKIHGIVGENGSGKTTLFNCLSNRLKYKGLLSVNGYRSIGYLPTELYVYPRIKGIEFVEFCLKAKECNIDYCKIENLNQIFMLPLDRYAEKYSTGMLKKLHLFVLILQEHDLLLLDEPFNGLDIQSIMYVTELLKHINKRATIIISSHNLQHLVSFSDTISVLSQGTLSVYRQIDEFNSIVLGYEDEAKDKIKLIQ